jgi:TonB family protein
VPLDLTVLRSGIPDSISGRTLEIGEGGMGVAAPTELLVGESVRVEFLIPHTSVPVRATAVVRYQRDGCFGLQFLRLPSDQRSVIRYWTRRDGELLLASQPHAAARAAAIEPREIPFAQNSEDEKHWVPARRWVAFACAFVVIAAGLAGWQWQQAWTELEAQLPAQKSAAAQPELTLPADVMERQILHRSLPEYPEPARQAGVQGAVVLNAVVSREGTVTQLKVVSGPAALSEAALDAVRWWRYEPYLVNGQPVAVATTITVNFRLAQ